MNVKAMIYLRWVRIYQLMLLLKVVRTKRPKVCFVIHRLHLCSRSLVQLTKYWTEKVRWRVQVGSFWTRRSSTTRFWRRAIHFEGSWKANNVTTRTVDTGICGLVHAWVFGSVLRWYDWHSWLSCVWWCKWWGYQCWWSKQGLINLHMVPVSFVIRKY